MSYNKSKQQGTDFEREVTRKLAAALGPHWLVTPLRVGGRDDPGDILVQRIGSPFEVVIQARNRGSMNVHATLADAMRSAAKTSAHRLAAVAWKRLERKEGAARRTQVGVPVVAVSLATFAELLAKAGDLGQLAGSTQHQSGD